MQDRVMIFELPEFWQEKIRDLRSENHSLRTRLRDTQRLAAQELPPSWEKKLRKLRDENVQLRKERNAFRDELAARGDCNECHCQIASDAACISKGECPRSGAQIGSRGNCIPGHWDSCGQCPLRATEV